MMVTLIGSRAMASYFDDARRPVGDWDWQSSEPVEDDFFTPWDEPRRNDVFVDSRLSAWPWGLIATPDEMLTMKISHAYWELGNTWDKHASDIVFLQKHGAKFIPELHDLLL